MTYRIISLLMVTMIIGGLGFCAQAQSSAKALPVKVFILAGQSNMEGKGAVQTIAYLGKDGNYGSLLNKIRDKDNKWVTRDDVWISYGTRSGNLTVGFGSNSSQIGPELMFGVMMGDLYENQVLLIKTCWGGHSLASKFRPPSSGGQVGESYTKILSEVDDCLKNLATRFPGYKGQGYELAGFVWFQGWNDMLKDEYRAEYKANLINLIKDLRKDLKAPGLPVVIGEMGVDGPNANAKIKEVRKAQKDAAEQPEFKGNVLFVPTVVYWDMHIEALYKAYKNKKVDPAAWAKAEPEWKECGSDKGYHYLGSGKHYCLIGYGMAEAMRELVKDRK